MIWHWRAGHFYPTFPFVNAQIFLWRTLIDCLRLPFFLMRPRQFSMDIKADGYVSKLSSFVHSRYVVSGRYTAYNFFSLMNNFEKLPKMNKLKLFWIFRIASSVSSQTEARSQNLTKPDWSGPTYLHRTQCPGYLVSRFNFYVLVTNTDGFDLACKGNISIQCYYGNIVIICGYIPLWMTVNLQDKIPRFGTKL